MTMIYLQQTNRKQKRTRKLIVYICLLIVLVVCANFFFPHVLSSFFQGMARPFFNSRLATASGMGSLWEFFHTKNQLVRENAELKEKLALLTALETEKKVLLQEKGDLEAQLGRITSTTTPDSMMLTRILSKPGFSPYDTFIIDAGMAAGVQQGSLVYADHSIVVGEISATYEKTSTATLFSSAGIKAEVFVGSKSIQAVAVGQGGGTLEIKLPQNTGVAVGDAIVLARDPEKVFGTVETIATNPTDSFERILFKSPVDISELKYVFIEH